MLRNLMLRSAQSLDVLPRAPQERPAGAARLRRWSRGATRFARRTRHELPECCRTT